MSDTKTVSGNIVHIQDKGTPTALSVIANITPKQSGTGTPSPDNVRQISGWESVSVYGRGKNLIDAVNLSPTSSARWVNTNGIAAKNNVQYTLSAKASKSLSNRVYVIYADKATITQSETTSGKTFLTAQFVTSDTLTFTFTTNNDAYIYLYIGDVVGDFTLSEVQIELGTTATTFAPYNGHTTTTPLGRTVYGGTLDVVSGVLTVDRAMVDLGTLDWTKYNVAEGTLFRASINTIKRTDSPSELPNIVCSHFPVKKQNERAEKTISQPTNISAVDIIDSTYADAESFKSAMNGVQLVYELHQPQTYTLTGQNVNLLRDCYAWADSGDISITYETYLINGLFHKIWINGVKMFAPNDFTLERSDVYAGEITTCTGKTIADRIGWKYADMSLNWDYLPQEYLETILNLSGVFTITFENEEGVQFTEQCIRKGSTMTGTRFTDNGGNMMWKGVQFDISFINVHN